MLANHSGPIILTGDININLASGGDSTAARRLRELLDAYSLEQHVRGPTYEPSGSAIDILCSNSSSARAGSLTCHYSPHRWLRALVTVPEHRPPQCSVTARCWGRFDVAEANRHLRCIDWLPVFSCADPASQWDYFVGKVTPILDSLAPMKRLKVRNPTAPPITGETRQLMSQRRTCLRYGNRDQYRDLNRRVRAAIRRDTRHALQERIQESGRGGMWRTIRPVLSGKQSTRLMPSADADSMNSYFAGVGTRIARQVDSSGPELPVRLPRVTSGRSQVQPVTPERLPAVPSLKWITARRAVLMD